LTETFHGHGFPCGIDAGSGTCSVQRYCQPRIRRQDDRSSPSPAINASGHSAFRERAGD
jgi:hypothetical protein